MAVLFAVARQIRGLFLAFPLRQRSVPTSSKIGPVRRVLGVLLGFSEQGVSVTDEIVLVQRDHSTTNVHYCENALPD